LTLIKVRKNKKEQNDEIWHELWDIKEIEMENIEKIHIKIQHDRIVDDLILHDFIINDP
jgi:hypothetical protein